MVIVDTTVWIDYLGGAANPETKWLDARADLERIGLTDLILSEVLQGIRSDVRYAEARDELLNFEVFSTGGVEFAIRAAENYRKLRKKGITVRKTADCWIATFCLLKGHELLHRDRDFDSFERELGLKVVRA